MSHADELMRLATEFAEAEAQSKWDGDCERASQSESRKSDEIRDSARAALREACEKLCGALDGLIDASSPFGPIDDGSVVWSKTRTELGFAITDARSALAHLTKGTA